MILFVFVKPYSKKNSSMKLMCRRLLCATSKMCGDRNAQRGCSYHVLILCWRVTDWCTYSTAQRKYNTYNISRIYISGYFIVRVCFVVVMFLSIDSIDTAIKRTTIPFTWTSFVFVNILHMYHNQVIQLLVIDLIGYYFDNNNASFPNA